MKRPERRAKRSSFRKEESALRAIVRELGPMDPDGLPEDEYDCQCIISSVSFTEAQFVKGSTRKSNLIFADTLVSMLLCRHKQRSGSLMRRAWWFNRQPNRNADA
jgi:hypothetical protein